MTPQELNAIKALTNSIRELNATLSEKSDVNIFVQSEAGMETKAVDIYRQTKSAIARAKVGLDPVDSSIQESTPHEGGQFIKIQGGGSYAVVTPICACTLCGTLTTDTKTGQDLHNATYHQDQS